MTALIADDGWRVAARPEGLVVTAGADLVYLLPDVPEPDARAVAAVFDEPSAFEPDALPAPARALLPTLQGLGALRPAALPTPARPRELTVAVHLVGTDPGGLLDALAGELSPADPIAADLRLVVRTTGSLRDLIDLAARLAAEDAVHLLLDLGYHHTAAIGPLVVPGAGACLGCLAVRAANRWGDPPAPARPAATIDSRWPAALAGHAVRRIGAGSLALLQRTVAHHLDELTGTAEDVLPSADCALCATATTGRLQLPWEDPR